MVTSYGRVIDDLASKMTLCPSDREIRFLGRRIDQDEGLRFLENWVSVADSDRRSKPYRVSGFFALTGEEAVVIGFMAAWIAVRWWVV